MGEKKHRSKEKSHKGEKSHRGEKSYKEKAEAFVVAQRLTLQDTAPYLRDFLTHWEDGQIVLRRGEQELVLRPEGELDVVFKASKKKGKQKFSLKLQWEEPKSEQASEEEPAFEIAGVVVSNVDQEEQD
ncbi:MAG: amphi-Trp domain-containing protein [Myxococcota bacterium]